MLICVSLTTDSMLSQILFHFDLLEFVMKVVVAYRYGILIGFDPKNTGFIQAFKGLYLLTLKPLSIKGNIIIMLSCPEARKKIISLQSKRVKVSLFFCQSRLCTEVYPETNLNFITNIWQFNISTVKRITGVRELSAHQFKNYFQVVFRIFVCKLLARSYSLAKFIVCQSISRHCFVENNRVSSVIFIFGVNDWLKRILFQVLLDFLVQLS